MKIAVIIPIMAPEVAKDWEYVVHCLNRTLKSVLNNNETDCRAYVICQIQPADMIVDHRIEFVKANIPIPDSNDCMAKRQDKGSKIVLGFKRAAKFQPDYIMQIDADDMISSHLFRDITRCPGYDAYCVNCGYEWFEGSRILTKRYSFHKYCGSTFIAKYNAELFPFWIGNKLPHIGGRVCDNPHTHIEQALLARGFNVYYFNKPVVVYLSGGTDHLRESGGCHCFAK